MESLGFNPQHCTSEQVFNPSTLERESRGLEVQDHPLLQVQFEACLRHMEDIVHLPYHFLPLLQGTRKKETQHITVAFQ